MLLIKIVTGADWRAAGLAGVYAGSADDRRDGFIHLSAPGQVRGTLARHFAGHDDLVLLGVAAAALGAALRWEPARSGEPFPHLYGPLPLSAVQEVAALRRDAAGVPLLPDWADA